MTKLKNLIVFDEMDTSINGYEFLPDKELCKKAGITLYHMYQVIRAGRNAAVKTLKEPTADSVCLLCYTSGTTGKPKGVK